MPERIATIDTSVLLSLQCTGMIGAASVLFSRLLVPSAVRREVAAGGERNVAAARALADFALFVPCDDFDPASVEILLQERRFRGEGRDQGEAEAVAQASQLSVQMILVDDAFGRSMATSMSIECHGTLWIFDQLRAAGYIDELRPHFLQLIRNQRRQPLTVMNESLRRFGETEITQQECRRLITKQKELTDGRGGECSDRGC